jgi:tetratricopeptide (TPR) repeat protein
MALPLQAQDLAKRPSLEEEPPAISEKDQDYQRLLDQGLEAFIEGNYKRAGLLFRKAVKLKPDDLTARNALKAVDEKMAEVMEGLKEIEKQDIAKAKQHYQQKQYLLAAMILQTVLERNVNQVEAKKWMRKIDKRMEKLSENEALYSFDWMVHKGVSAYIQERYEHAIVCWQRATQLDPQNQVVVLALEQTKNYLENHPEMVGIAIGFGKKISECDERQEVNFQLREEFIQLSQEPFGPAWPQEERGVEGTPYGPFLSKTEQGEQEKLAEMQEKSKSTEPVVPEEALLENEPPEIVEAMSLLNQKNYVEAIKLFEKYMRLNPWYPKTEELLNKAILEQRQASYQHYNEGILAYANGNYSKAFEEWQMTLKIHPQHPTAKKVLLKAFFRNR